MADNDLRHITRDSLFLMADLRLKGEQASHRVKVRNLSAGGMMGEGDTAVVRGAPVQVQIRNIGWVDGVIAWVQGNRCGIAFSEDIDPMIARAPVGNGETTPRFVKPPLHGPDQQPQLRKI